MNRSMAIKIKMTRPELKRRRDALRRFERYLPMLKLKQQVNGKTRDDHRAIMDGCIQLYAMCRESREKRDMGFEMSGWDKKLLKYGLLFEERIMDLSVNVPLFTALDRCWALLAECFERPETGIQSSIIEKHWPKPLS